MAKAVRRQLFAYETTLSTRYMHGPTEHKTYYRIGRVASVSRQGEITAYQTDGEFRVKGRPAKVLLIPADRFGDATWSAWTQRESPRDFSTLEQLKTWLMETLTATPETACTGRK